MHTQFLSRNLKGGGYLKALDFGSVILKWVLKNDLDDNNRIHISRQVMDV
jgi:hypothetical protein